MTVYHLGEMSISQVLLSDAKVIFIVILGNLELLKITLKTDLFNCISGHLMLDEAVLDLLSLFIVEERRLSGSQASLHGLEVSQV